MTDFYPKLWTMFASLVFCVFMWGSTVMAIARLVETSAAITKTKTLPDVLRQRFPPVRILLIRKDMKLSECRSEQICFNGMMPHGSKKMQFRGV